eukprot:TRINITY_DN665_c1_g4_i2.p1 TRINITY_DN665_c1_g4~~TRINITY_DN665_c1_g4_i2.p1  ORF type:complete len:631 (+),score=130.29 TRINITY_DN665_c1_g4_i2:174-2066(+)
MAAGEWKWVMCNSGEWTWAFIPQLTEIAPPKQVRSPPVQSSPKNASPTRSSPKHYLDLQRERRENSKMRRDLEKAEEDLRQIRKEKRQATRQQEPSGKVFDLQILTVNSHEKNVSAYLSPSGGFTVVTRPEGDIFLSIEDDIIGDLAVLDSQLVISLTCSTTVSSPIVFTGGAVRSFSKALVNALDFEKDAPTGASIQTPAPPTNLTPYTSTHTHMRTLVHSPRSRTHNAPPPNMIGSRTAGVRLGRSSGGYSSSSFEGYFMERSSVKHQTDSEIETEWDALFNERCDKNLHPKKLKPVGSLVNRAVVARAIAILKAPAASSNFRTAAEKSNRNRTQPPALPPKSTISKKMPHTSLTNPVPTPKVGNTPLPTPRGEDRNKHTHTDFLRTTPDLEMSKSSWGLEITRQGLGATLSNTAVPPPPAHPPMSASVRSQQPPTPARAPPTPVKTTPPPPPAKGLPPPPPAGKEAPPPPPPQSKGAPPPPPGKGAPLPPPPPRAKAAAPKKKPKADMGALFADLKAGIKLKSVKTVQKDTLAEMWESNKESKQTDASQPSEAPKAPAAKAAPPPPAAPVAPPPPAAPKAPPPVPSAAPKAPPPPAPKAPPPAPSAAPKAPPPPAPKTAPPPPPPVS